MAKIKECKTPFEAATMVFSGFYFFLATYTKTTVIVCAFILGAPSYVLFDYFTLDRAKVELAKPLGENVIEFTLIPSAVAATKGAPRDSIIINGKLYGYSDPHFSAWKVLDAPVILLWDKEHDAVYKIEAPVTHDKLQQYKK